MDAPGASTDAASVPTRFRPSFGAPGTAFVYQPKPLGATRVSADAPRLAIALPDAPMYMLFAHRQWRAGMLLADAIYAHALDLSHKNVLELGAGTGLPALTAALCTHARKVVATDYDDDSIIAALRANVQRTLAHHTPQAPLIIAPHTWGQGMDDVLDLLSARTPTWFDVVLLADCVWERFSHAALVKSIATLLTRSDTARVYMVAGLHTGRATLVHFLRQMLGAGLCLAPVPGAWPTPPPTAGTDLGGESHTYLPGSEHIRELQVEGALESDTHAPSLSGRARPFVVDRTPEEPTEERNRWLTVSCFRWAT